MVVFKRSWSQQVSETKRNGCSSHDSGLSILAAPSTMPAPVRNITFALVPVSTGRVRERRPPGRDITFNLPVTRLPSSSRSTAGVRSVTFTRVARSVGCDWGKEFMPESSIPLFAPPAQVTEGLVRSQYPVFLFLPDRRQALTV